MICIYRWIGKTCCGCIFELWPTGRCFLINPVAVNTSDFVPSQLDTACCVLKFADCRSNRSILFRPTFWVVTADCFAVLVNATNCIGLCLISTYRRICKTRCSCVFELWPTGRCFLINSVTVRTLNLIPRKLDAICCICKTWNRWCCKIIT